ncbi:MAG TPA: TolC family protein [Chitinophagaceae bacterium]
MFFTTDKINAQNFVKDSLKINIQQAEKIFRNNNFQLLAQKYNIDAQKALIIQARLWPNPNLSLDKGPVIPIHDPLSNYPYSNFFLNSENVASISQLIVLAGKRNKQIKLAEANAFNSEFQFLDLLRSLRYSLRSDFYNIYYLQQSARVYAAEIKALQQIVHAFSQQLGKGYIAEKEVVRVEAQLYSFQAEYIGLLNQIKNLESQLRMLMQVNPNIYICPLVDSELLNSLDPSKYSIAELLDSALNNRTDLKIAKSNTTINRLNYDYQKSLSVPDLTASFSYDKQGSYATNFNSIGLSMDLPFFNRNQGNIKSAKIMIDNTAVLQKNIEVMVEENVSNALEIAYEQNKLFQTIDTKFSENFDRLVLEVLINYQKRNIGLLDFLDFYDSYKQNVLQVNTIKYNRVQAFEDLNFYTATNLFN